MSNAVRRARQFRSPEGAGGREVRGCKGGKRFAGAGSVGSGSFGPASFGRRFFAGLILLAAGNLGCAAGSFGRDPLPSLLPDAAAVAAAARARARFEAAHPPYPDPALVARVGEIGRRAMQGSSFRRSPAGPGAAGAESGRTAAANGSASGAEEIRAEEIGAEETWVFSVTDRASPEAYLFADRAVFLSRGALAALGSEAALEALFRVAAARYAGGGFRSGGGAPAEQPVRLPVEPFPQGPFPQERRRDGRPAGSAVAGGNGGAGPPEGDGPATEAEREPGTDGGASDRWVSLLDGLTLGEPPSRGGGRGRDLFLPAAGIRLRAPAGFLFAPGGGGRQVAERGSGAALAVSEHPAPAIGNPAAVGGEPPVGGPTAGAARSFEAERRLVRALELRLRRGDRAERIEFFEKVRVRGVVGVLARLRAVLPADDPPASEYHAAGASSGGAVAAKPVAPEPVTPEVTIPEGIADGAESRREVREPSPGPVPGPAPGYRALLRTPRRLVEISFACGDRAPDRRADPAAAVPGPACENSFMEMVRSVERLPAAVTPGWLRLRAVSVDRRQSVDAALRALVAEGRSDVPLSVLRELNRSRPGGSLAPGDRLLVARRDPVGEREGAGAPGPPED